VKTRRREGKGRVAQLEFNSLLRRAAYFLALLAPCRIAMLTDWGIASI
jgi:hypothetical protein